MANQKNITWKAEVEFVGNVDEFVTLAEALSAAQIKIIDKWESTKFPRYRAGYIAPPLLDIAPINKMLNESKAQRIANLINGGIRTPHFHLGKEIVLVDRDQFKTILGEIARDVFENRALQMEDYMDAVTPLVAIEK